MCIRDRLLRQPYAPIDWQTTARLASACDRELTLLRLSSLARSVDYAGSNARQLRHLEGRSATEEQRLRRRLHWYCREARELIDGNQALQPLDDLLAAVEGSS